VKRTAVALASLLGLGGSLLAVPAPAEPAVPSSFAPSFPVLERRVIGHSVRGRDLVAWHLGEPDTRTYVLISTMHGNEPHTRAILQALRDGPAFDGINIWVLPTYNPDGLAAHSRKNAHGVDLNRNFPYDWRDLDGNYESGPRPGSEPETRAVMAWLREIRPERVLSFHQPLLGVDTDTKDAAFARRVARTLRLPSRTLDCGGVCHGTMTGWFNHRFSGAALTIEYGAHPTRHRMRVEAPRQVVRLLGGGFHDWLSPGEQAPSSR
jgi:murein peptide amidase A